MMPNTPRYYLERGHIEVSAQNQINHFHSQCTDQWGLFLIFFLQEAEDALKFYKGYKGSNNNQPEDYAIHKEFKRLKAITANRKHADTFSAADLCKCPTKMKNANSKCSILAQMVASLNKMAKFFHFHSFWTDNFQTLRGILIGVSLSIFAEFTGLSTITSYCVTTFQKTTFQKHGTSICPYKSSCVLAVALTLGSMATAYLADKFGIYFTGFIKIKQTLKKKLNFLYRPKSIDFNLVAGLSVWAINSCILSSFKSTWLRCIILWLDTNGCSISDYFPCSSRHWAALLCL